MRKHISAYNREEIIRCLTAGNLMDFGVGTTHAEMSTDILREYLSDAIQDGIAPEIEALKALKE